MKYYLKSNSKELFELDETMVIGEIGNDGTVHKYKDKAIKILHISSSGFAMTEKKAKIFNKKIKLKKFLCVEDLIYDENHNYSGYSTRYEKEDYDKTVKMSTKIFLNNVNDLLIDIKNLSIEKCYIIDLFQENFELNCICNDGIWPIDMDNYKINFNKSSEDIYIKNIRALKLLIIQIFSILYHKQLMNTGYDSDIINEINYQNVEILSEHILNENLLEYFSGELLNYNTIEEYLNNRIIESKRYLSKK